MVGLWGCRPLHAVVEVHRVRVWYREIRVTIVVIVLAVIAVIALWPRESEVSSSAPGLPAPNSSRASVMEGDDALAALRQRAALQPCPAADAGVQEGPLTGLVVPCLGDSRPVSLSAAYAGRPALLNVWASWCLPCRKELPALAEYARRQGALPVVGVNVQDRASSALELLTEVGVHYPSVVDVNGQLQVSLQTPPVLPVTYLLLPDGSVRRIAEPSTFSTADEVAEAVRRYLPTGG